MSISVNRSIVALLRQHKQPSDHHARKGGAHPWKPGAASLSVGSPRITLENGGNCGIDDCEFAWASAAKVDKKCGGHRAVCHRQ